MSIRLGSVADGGIRLGSIEYQALTGTAIDADAVALTLTANAASINAATGIMAGVDTLTLTENAAGIAFSTVIEATSQTLTLTPSEPLAFTILIGAEAESLTLTPNNALVGFATEINAGAQSLTLTEYGATVGSGLDIAAGSDSFSLTANSASISYDVSIDAGTTSFSLTPNAAEVFPGVRRLPKAGGRSSRKRYVVEVDGQLIQVATPADVLAVLQQAAEIAEEQVEVVPPSKIRVRTSAGKPVESKTVVAAVKRTQKRINKAIIEAKKRQAVDREISALLVKSIERQEEDDAIIMLLVS